MDPDVHKKAIKFTQKKIIIIAATVLAVFFIAAVAQLAYMMLSYDKSYKYVYVDNFDVGSMKHNDIKKLLEKNYTDKEKTNKIILKCKDSSVTLAYSDINVSYDIDKAADNAFNIGRSGSVFTRTFDIIAASVKKQTVEMPVTYDKVKLENIIDSLSQKYLVAVKQSSLKIQADKVVLHSGKRGESIDKDRVMEDIDQAIKDCRGGTITLAVKETQPDKVNIDEYLSKINSNVVNASFKVENNKYTVTPEVVGRSIDKDQLASAISDAEKNEDSDSTLPVKFVTPTVTTKDVYAKLFKDELGSFSTVFRNDTDINRSRAGNIKLAVSAINGKILAPGEVFSFNDTVGPRTEETGYGQAYTYVNGKEELGVGGGICQVASTLYNAVLLADLNVVSRSNHFFTVSYVPLGRDATVAYGSTDFKFKNSTNWPLRVDAYIGSGNRLVFSLRGTNDNPGKTVEIIPQTIKSMDFKTVYIDDPTLNEGVTSVKQMGTKGYVVDTYVIVRQNGKIIRQGKIHTSTYNPLETDILRGTKKTGKPKPPAPPPATQQPSTQEQKPSDQQTQQPPANNSGD
ncbi:MAG: VanW family protein [Bacillota bacterium]|nr:VanW family protein [Bacillota bacterium]